MLTIYNRQNFHIDKEESLDELTEREISIEVRIDFSDHEQCSKERNDFCKGK